MAEGGTKLSSLLPILFGWLAIAIQPALASSQAPAISDLFELKNLVEVQISPSGDRLAYVVSAANLASNLHDTSVWVVAVGGGVPLPLNIEAEGLVGLGMNPSIQWTGDGNWLCFIGQTETGSQVFRIAPGAETAEQITHSETPVRSFRWAADCNSLAYAATRPESAQIQQRIVEQRYYQSSSHPQPPVTIWIQRIDSILARAITPQADYVSSFDWSPDGASLVYAAAAGSDFMATFNTRLFVVGRDGSSRRLLVDGPGLNTAPKWSPRGDRIAYQSNWGDQTIMTNTGLAIVSAAGGEVIPLTRARDRVVSAHEWDADGSGLYVLASGGLDRASDMGAAMFESQLYHIDIDSRGDLGGGLAVRALTHGAQQVQHLSLDRAGAAMAYKISHGASMGDVFVRKLAPESEVRITSLHPAMQKIDWSPPEAMSWHSVDGQTIWGLLVAANRPRTGPEPLLVYVHGGPVGGFAYGIYPQFSHTVAQVSPYPVQALAAAGITVFMPMPRGGHGYGSAGLRAIIGNWGIVDYQDIMSGVDALVERGIADPERLGVAGGSYGGYMTNWIVTQTDRFRAASSWAGVCDLADLYSLSDAGDFTLGYFGTPWDNPQAYRRHSPITYLGAMNTPLLIQHGAVDDRVPTSEAIQCHKILAAQGKPAILEIYPRAGHVAFEPRMQMEIQARNLQWFRQHLLGSRLPGS